MKNPKPQKRPSYKLEGVSINKNLLEKFLTIEKTKKINIIDDLSELNTKSQSELFDIISQMMKNKTFFKYCYSILININPGPEYVYDYLNLKEWLLEQKNQTNENNKNKKEENKPHLYSFMKYVYDSMIAENKNQVVSILGPLGSGKTFNLIHIMEYFTTLYSTENNALDNFDLVHKSIQFIHILSSTFREYNLESSSCGLLLSLGFNEKNIICDFDIDAQIFDFTLPFNENGRTISILYSLIRGANDNLKRKCKIPANDDNLFNLKTKKKSYFVNDKKKEKLELNDLEIFNRFYSLLKYFKFTQGEIIDIINCFAFMLNLNSLMINKTVGGQLKNINFYEIQIGITTKKLAKNLGLFDAKNIEYFEKKLSENKFKTMQEMDIFIQGLIKQTYYVVFQYILDKIKSYISDYFANQNSQSRANSKTNRKKPSKDPKYLYFIDFPGEAEERTLGGFTINIAHECLNMYSASGYYEIVEKILLENILLKRFKPLKSYTILSNCFNKGGILDYFSKKLSLENFEQMKENIMMNQNIFQCYKFPERRKENDNDYSFYCSFSNKYVKYNYDFLFKEVKTLLFNPKIFEILSFASNIIISQTLKQRQSKLEKLNTFYDYFSHCLQKFFVPLKNYKPFVVYCLHSNDSHKYFFCNKNDNAKLSNINENDSEMYIKIVKRSLIPVIVNWNWYGYKEWIKIDDFLKEFATPFENVQNIILYYNNTDSSHKNNYKIEEKSFDFKNLEKKDKAKCILQVLSKENEYVIGEEYILLKQGTLKKIAQFLNSMIETAEGIYKKLLKKEKTSHSISHPINLRKNSSPTEKKRRTKTKDELTNNSNTSKKKSGDIEKFSLPKKKNIKTLEDNIYAEKPEKRRNVLRDQCDINIISMQKDTLKLMNQQEKNKILESKYLNINHILNKNKEEKIQTEDMKLEELINQQDEQVKKNIPTRNNTIVSDPIFFNRVKTLFDNSKSKNVKLFDYSENTDLIIRIQTLFRSLLAQRKYKILKYATYKIIQVQKIVKAMIIRKKVHFYLKCSNSVLLLQRLYKKRYKKMIENAIKIQRYFRQKLKERAERDLLLIKKKLELEKDKYSYINVDKIMEKMVQGKNDKDWHNIVLNLGIDPEENKKMGKRKINIIDVTKDLMRETNPDTIADLLIYSRLPEDSKDNRRQIKRSKSDFYKIEDKLIHEGILQKQRREKLGKIKEMEDSKMTEYMPKLSKKNEMITKKYPDDFLKRVEYFNLFKKRNLENLRNKNYMEISNELLFEPKINNETYYDIQSRFFNIYYGEKEKEKTKGNENKINYSDIINLSSKGNDDLIDNNKNIKENKEMNLKNKKEINEEGKLRNNNINKELWPKNMKNKYMEFEKLECKKDNK